MRRLLIALLVIVGTFLAMIGFGAPTASASSVTVVSPNQSIQKAVDAADPGDTIQLQRGTYRQNVFIGKNRITIRGAGTGTVLTPGNEDNCAAASAEAAGSGICAVGTTANPVVGVRIFELTVDGFAGFGIVGFGTDRFRVSQVTARNNGAYGITEFESTRGSFTKNRAIDNGVEAGLYVGDIADARGTIIADNYASGNALGVLVRNAHNVKVTDNTLVGNCTGIALVDVPVSQGDTRISDNVIAHNNKVCPPHEEVPPLGGTGILIFGGQHNTIVDNKIIGNQGTQPFSGGVVLKPGLAGNAATGNVIKDNTITRNSPLDILDNGGGTNTFRENKCTSSDPPGLCHNGD